MVEQNLAGKLAVVTGSNSGIGLGVAEALAAAGADLVINSFTDRDEDHALAKDLADRHGVEVRYVAADMSKAADCRALIAAAGRCDILINNAGIQHVAPIEEFPQDKWDAILAINLSSAFHTTAAALPLMRDKGWGRVVNIASAHGLTASPFKSAYVAAKAAELGLTREWAVEFLPDGVRVKDGYRLAFRLSSTWPTRASSTTAMSSRAACRWRRRPRGMRGSAGTRTTGPRSCSSRVPDLSLRRNRK